MCYIIIVYSLLHTSRFIGFFATSLFVTGAPTFLLSDGRRVLLIVGVKPVGFFPGVIPLAVES
jgi:hypothetical protein